MGERLCDQACPICIDWLLEIDIAEPVGLDVVAPTLDGLWRPCAGHSRDPFLLEVAG